MRAIDLTRKPIVTIDVAATLQAAAERMHDQRVGALVVEDRGVPVGLVTDRDIVVRGVRTAMPADARVDAVMTQGVVAFDADGDAADALAVLRGHAFRRLPLVRDGKLVALLSTDDVLVDIANRLVEIVHPITDQLLFVRPERDESPAVPSAVR